MRIAVLGPLEVQTDDLAPVPVPGAKERLLLAALVAGAPGVVSTDSLTETLWDGDPPDSARKSLQAHVVRLRSALEPDRPRGSTGRFVVRRGSGYALTLDRSAIDALHMGDLAARGHARLVSGDLVEAEQDLRDAVDLWRGEPYADWSDADFAEAERHRLAEVYAGSLAGHIEAQLQLGRHAEALPRLEQLVTEEPLREDWWRLLLLGYYRAGRQADALAAGRRARAVLADELGIDPGPALRAMETAVLAQDPALDAMSRRTTLPADAVPASGSCPYKGLAAYQVDDAPLFHGRSRLVAGLVARLVDSPVLLVSGPSGAGKSSAVRAGLVPALAGGALPGSRTWRPTIVTPGTSPVDVLAPLTGDPPPEEPVLLVCDQFEELWGPAVDPVERSAFLDAVLGLIDDGIVARCVVVVRGDHVGRLAEHPAFAEHIGATLALVPALTDGELREIVREPARTVGLRVDPELIDAIVTDVLGQVGALPLLSAALVGTWERRRGDVLTLAGYLEAGGVEGALTRSAEAAHGGLDETGQDLARRLFVRLADTDDGGALVRRSVPLAELDLDDESRRSVVEAFVGRRLLAVDGDRLEVAHEALLVAWPRLARWLDDDAAGRAVRRHLAPSARDWDRGGRPDDELYRGARLAAALDWAARDDAQPTSLERQFLAVSQERAEAELREARDQVARERRARRRTRRLAAVLAAVLAVALVATLLAVRFQQNADARAIEAERLSLVADANRLAALADAEEAVDLSLLLGAQAVRLEATLESRHQLLGALLERRRALGVVTVSETPVGSTLARDTLYLDDGRRLSAWSVSSGPEPVGTTHPVGTWGRWIAADGSPTDDRLLAAGADIYGRMWVRLLHPDATTTALIQSDQSPALPLDVTFSGDGRRVLLVTADVSASADTPRPWRMTEVDLSGAGLRETGIAGILPAGADPPAADISDDGRLAVVSSSSGAAATATLVSLPDGQQVPLLIPQRGVASIGFRALDSGIAQLWTDGAVTRYGMDGHPVQQFDAAGPDPVVDVVVSPDATWAAAVGGGGRVTVWDVDPGTGGWTLRASFVGHDGDIRNAEVSGDGARLVTVGADDRLVAWDVTPAGTFGTPVGVGGDRRLASRPQVIEPGRLVAALTRPAGGAADAAGPQPWPAGAAVTFFDLRTGDVVDSVPLRELHFVPELSVTPTGDDGSILAMAVSPDRRRIAVTTGLTVTVIDADRREPVHRFDLPADGVMMREGHPLPAAPVLCLEWTSDSSRLVLGTERFAINEPLGALVRVDPSTGREEFRELLSSVPDGIIAHPDEPTFLVSDLDGAVQAIDERTLMPGRFISSVKHDRATGMSFSPDRRRLLVTDESNRLYVIDPETGGSTEHQFAWDLLQAEWMPDGRTIALSSTDGSVRLYDPETGELLTRAFSASGDGRAAHVRLFASTDELVALSGERPGRRWPLDPASWVQEACAAVGRDFSRAEWERYLPDRPYRRTCTDLE